MILFLAGSLRGVTERSCLALTPGGVGYEVFLTKRHLAALPGIGGQVEFFIKTVVREDAIDLFGFPSMEEREIFSLLLTVHQLGPKISLAVLSTFDPRHLMRLVAREDIRALTSVPGIGNKTATRLLLDLKDKLAKMQPVDEASVPEETVRPHLLQDLLGTLLHLGYKESQAEAALREVLSLEPDLDAEGAIRSALRLLSKANT